jgi:hypothetical protein
VRRPSIAGDDSALTVVIKRVTSIRAGLWADGVAIAIVAVAAMERRRRPGRIHPAYYARLASDLARLLFL